MDNPVIVQSDRTILLEVDHPRYAEARDTLASFAELVKSPEHIHTYRITPISLWNAAALGLTPAEILKSLRSVSRYDVPENIDREITDFASRYGVLVLRKIDERLLLESTDALLLQELANSTKVKDFFLRFEGPNRVEVPGKLRGHLKQALIRIGWPVEDQAGFDSGDPFPIGRREQTLEGRPFTIRKYQADSVASYLAGGGGGVVVLPCGAGKTIV
ncbi:MAG: helicase-associated domain-containing protein, partial [Candidatus Brocadiia bacterium]